ncbi:MAG: hypothetical protein KC546_10025 [Anaerolineae bacterium]|nr:hypothetical protein [Anaerolineae bacterium]MCA9888701.1 hypothetical protein [Anaerolineae bacterium]MCA9892071.1 hypothetical protein [Anaerolineae bacterium]MCB9460201.1 hypothetical protein [Anaerolineaceae bacterium]
MPYDMTWLIEDAIIHEKLYGDFEITDIHVMVVAAKQMIAQSNRDKVHLLVDVADVGKIPLSVREIASETMELYRDERIGWTIAYGSKNKVVRMVATIVLQLFKGRQVVVNTEADALTFLAKQDDQLAAQLNDLLNNS